MTKITKEYYNKLLQQLDREEIPVMLKGVSKDLNDPAAIEASINEVVKKTNVLHPYHKAFVAKDVASMGIGQKVQEELGDLSNLSAPERVEKIRQHAYTGMPELRSQIKSGVDDKYLKTFEDLQNKIIVNPDLPYHGESTGEGIILRDNKIIPISHRINTDLHELGHNLDDALRLARIKYEYLMRLDSKNPQVAKELSSLKKSILEMQAAHPKVYDMFRDKEIKRHPGAPYREHELMYGTPIETKKSPVDLSKQFIGEKHHFKRHFEFDNLLNILKGGLKNVKSITPVLAKAGAAAAGGLASLAAEAADAEALGDNLAENAMIRERDEQVRRNKALKQATPEQREILKEMYNELDSGNVSNIRSRRPIPIKTYDNTFSDALQIEKEDQDIINEVEDSEQNKKRYRELINKLR